jgi:hypothetical protein
MLIKTLHGDLFSIDLDEKETTLECIKEKIAEIDPCYHPFTQVLFPLRDGPLRPFQPDDLLGVVQQRVRIQFSKPQFRILIDQDSIHFPIKEHVSHFVWLITIQYKHKKGFPKKIVKNVFLYDPLTNLFALPCAFVSKYHRVEPYYTFLLSHKEIVWYSSLK